MPDLGARGGLSEMEHCVGAGALSLPSGLERDYHGARPLAPGHRLGCAASICGPVVIDVPPESQVHHQVVRKAVDVTGLVLDPGFVLAYLDLEPCDIGSATSVPSVLDRTFGALASQHAVSRSTSGRVELAALGALSRAAATVAGSTTLTVAMTCEGKEGHVDIVGAWPGFVDTVLGVAIDLGSTTIAAHLCDLSTGDVIASNGRMNPQIRFGEDLMSRVSYVMMHPDGAQSLKQAARGAINELIGDLLADAGHSAEHVLDVVIVANPIMHHLLLGLDVVGLGQAPFSLVTNTAVNARAVDVQLDLPFSRLYVGPCIAGHVGADTSAAILAEGTHRADIPQLLVDIGTNAEIVLGDRRRLYAASSPTGPAFEGAQISCGQRAAVGAIERVRVDPETLDPRYKVIGCDVWSDDPAFTAATLGIEISGVCGSGIVEVIAELFLAGVIAADGTILNAERSRIVQDGRTFAYVLHEAARLRITQADVRAVQLAKAALRAGIDLLVERSGLSPAEIRLAGAFGAHIDPLYAMVLGLIPDGPLEAIRGVGNAAGSGAVRALLSRSQRAEMESMAGDVVKIETATEPRFQELFVAALAFPHANAPTPFLASMVTLPPVRSGAAGRARAGRARRPATT